MACYGMVKAMLKQGLEVELIMPAGQEVYFSLRNPADADVLPMVFMKPTMHKKTPSGVEEIRKLVGNPLSVYYTMARRGANPFSLKGLQNPGLFGNVLEILKQPFYLFGQVREYTAMAVDIASKLSFDVIHAHDWLTFPAGMILKAISGRPLVVHIHATEFDRAGGPGDRRIHDIEYAGTCYADRVIAVSDYTADTISEKYCISREKIKTVHNAYTLADSTRDYGRIFKEPTVLFLGRITLQKGPDYFLEIARKVIGHNKNVRFIMAGSGDMERAVLHRAAYLGLGTRFLAAGFLERDEVENILSATDIFILPSVSEPFGIAPLEAMSRGAVAIISKHAGVAEVIQTAYKIDFWDIDQMVSAIIHLIENPEEFRQMSERGRAEVASLQWDEAVKKIIGLFYELQPLAKC